ncbi:ABC transporter ATP-binding protein [Stieleria varia]|uniref:Daunorubicin/doxorubicin resistance ATP-binding protein DrrA n=1 Tax=Stieleria varia TaxID=2528005 RepID=A0A5C6A3V4_9BACT|nr:ABC transporter ATP-binding protein [Stieleria varia]TWT94574.1 Daunorubicin/doxorubicin resistance ATP-binding protein DrrA [Stieleria varia]
MSVSASQEDLQTVHSASDVVCEVSDVRFSYGETQALQGVNLRTSAGEIVALLGKNGSGKTTLFRLLCTLLPIQSGSIRIGGIDSASNPLAIRGQIGIVFQSPSLDKKLTVDENIACQAALYGIGGKHLNERRDAVLEQMELTDRRRELCEKLSGGLKRRVELAKGMLHRPKLMLLDEPSTGLDPSARINLFQSLRKMCDDGVSVLMTTHLLEEAEKADRVVIMADGAVVREGTPHELRSEMGEGVVTVIASDPAAAIRVLRDELHLDAQQIENQIRIHSDSPADLVPTIHSRLGNAAQSISIGRPSLEDVFIAATGTSFHA